MGKPFSEEINITPSTLEWAYKQSVKELERLVTRWSDGPLIVVGSGGSYSAANAWSSFHRKALGTPSFPTTPLQLASYLNSLRNCRVLLLSAEGKNHDILNAAKIAVALDVPCAALTLTLDNPLTDLAFKTRSLYSFNYEMGWGKDGYLATNTLLAMIAIAVKTYFPNEPESRFVSHEYLTARRMLLDDSEELNHPRENGVLVLYGSESELFALDLESKISEAAITKCEIADFRQFSHGRHLQLAENAYRVPLVIVAYTTKEKFLADELTKLFPPGVKICRILISGTTLVDYSISSVIESLLITEAIGKKHHIDPGNPDVPDFGRAIYSFDSALYQNPINGIPILDVAVLRKIGDSNTSEGDKSLFLEKANTYLLNLEQKVIKAIVCDFDGTLCHAHLRFEGLDLSCANELIRLIDLGLIVGVATGRGGSVIEKLRQAIPEKYWSKIWVGIYSGSKILRLDEEFTKPPAHLDLESALQWIDSTSFRNYGIANRDNGCAGQLSLRICDHFQASQLASALSAWINKTNRDGWRVFSSGHSVDLLHPSASKLNLVSFIATLLKIDSSSEILKVGDAGQPGGNDFELLDQPISLSADKVSESLTSCWNFAPAGLRQADATNFYLKNLTATSEGVKIKLSERI